MITVFLLRVNYFLTVLHAEGINYTDNLFTIKIVIKNSDQQFIKNYNKIVLWLKNYKIKLKSIHTCPIIQGHTFLKVI